MSNEIRCAYDEVPYESHPFAESHPDRLAAMALLFGMQPRPIERCRVLELGCAAGGNLIPMAAQLPDSEFVGVDLSGGQVSDGQALIAALGLKNITLLHKSIMDVDRSLGEFDYIICHGVYSWVPEAVQDRIMAICGQQLAPQGVAYISYNTYPGWHFRGMIRDMMIYHTRHLADPAARVAQARALLDFLSQSVVTDTAYGMMLKDELNLLQKCRDSYLFHEHLEDVNKPLYFHQFIERAAEHGLQYLGETALSAMLTSNFPKQVAETLNRVSSSLARTEQYMDFLRNRTFRQTLLCRRGIALERNLTPESIMCFYIASPAKPVQRGAGSFDKFITSRGAALEPAHPVVHAAFRCLTERWPQALSFDELYALARASGSSSAATDPGDRQVLASDVLKSYTANIVELRTRRVDFVTSIGAHPTASRLAREQVKKDRVVTNQRHEAVVLDDVNRHLLPFLDGGHDREALLDELVRLVGNRVLNVQQDDAALTEGAALRAALAHALDQGLSKLARSALLVA